MTRNNLNGIMKYFAICCLILLGMQNELLADTALPIKDIRVVIDLSGSMKINDPQNHRTKAVQLFSEVLPNEVYSGIWTFAAEVNMLIKHGKVNHVWKKSAFKKANKIHSFGLHTNIEKALKKSTYDWYKNEPGKEKHLILLTDGYIDISKKKEKNAVSRNNVIEKIIPLFKKNKIQVHTIALSDQADHDLLKNLSAKTSGSYVIVKESTDLDRYFFKLFQSTAKPDTIPFKSNRFNIDKSISDMTIVLFNSNNPTKLLTPEKKYLTYDEHPENVKWVKSDNYEIITIANPFEGAWYVDAPVDPDNKIMVVTNLRLHVKKIPELLLPGDPMTMHAYMSENGKIIDQENFIKILSLKASVREAESISRDVQNTSYTGKGVFIANIDTNKYKNKNTLTVIAKGPTFTREYKHEFNIVTDPVILESKIKDENIVLKAYVDSRVIDNNGLLLSLDGDENKHKFIDYKTYWQVKLPSSFSGKTMKVNVNAKLQNGKPYSKILEIKLPILVAKIIEPVVTKKIMPGKAEVDKEMANTQDHKPAEQSESETTSDNDESESTSSFSWIIVFIIVLLVNALFVVGGYFIYKKVKKSAADEPSIAVDIEHENDEKEGESSAGASENTSNETDVEEAASGNDGEIEDIEELEEIEELDDLQELDETKNEQT